MVVLVHEKLGAVVRRLRGWVHGSLIQARSKRLGLAASMVVIEMKAGAVHGDCGAVEEEWWAGVDIGCALWRVNGDGIDGVGRWLLHLVRWLR